MPKSAPEGAPTYRILQREGCTIVYGHMPLGTWLRMLRQASDLHVLHPDVARMLGATAVIGPLEGLARIREQEAAAATGRVRAQLVAGMAAGGDDGAEQEIQHIQRVAADVHEQAAAGNLGAHVPRQVVRIAIARFVRRMHEHADEARRADPVVA